MAAKKEKNTPAKCAICGREHYSSVMRNCQLERRATCMYCCRKCNNNIFVGCSQECTYKNKAAISKASQEDIHDI